MVSLTSRVASLFKVMWESNLRMRSRGSSSVWADALKASASSAAMVRNALLNFVRGIELKELYTNFVHPLFSQPVSRLVAGNSLALGNFKNFQDCVVDGINLLQRARHVPAQHLPAATVDDSSGIGSVI